MNRVYSQQGKRANKQHTQSKVLQIFVNHYKALLAVVVIVLVGWLEALLYKSLEEGG